MRRDPDGPHDLGLTVGVVVTAGGDRTVGVQSGVHRYSLDPAEARTMAEALTMAADVVDLGMDLQGRPHIDPHTATIDDVGRAIASIVTQ